MKNYAKNLQSHLGTYKTARLGVKEKGAFTHLGKEMNYAHVLPKELKWLNIVEPVRAEVRQFSESRSEIKLHKYFHHLNSSQAFAFNLFYPYFSQGQSAVLLSAMGLKGSASAWYPEHVVDTIEGTNLDMSWQCPEGAWTYCEVKLGPRT